MKKYLLYIPVLLVIFLGCEEVLFEEDISEEPLAIIAPKDASIIESTTVNFIWEPVNEATDYHLQIARPDFENAVQIIEDTTVTATNFSTTLVKTNYEWRVRAQNSGFTTAYTNAKFSVVESGDFSARQVVLMTPENNEITNQTSVNLSWASVTDATSYRIQLLDTNNQIVDDQTATSTSTQLTFPEGVTKWQVRAENNTQSTLYTVRTVTIDSQNPKKPIGTAPINQANLTAPEVSFTWTREEVAGTVEFDSIYIYQNQELTQLVEKDRVTSPVEIALDAGNTYYWILKAFDEADNQSESSDVASFTIN